MGYYSVDILTPSEVVLKDSSADSLLIPTIRGQINILPGHTHIVEKLDTGVLSIFDYEKEEYFSITTGICKVFENKITFLVPVVENCHKIDLDRANKALEKSKQKLGDTSLSFEEVEKYQRKFDRAEIRIKLALKGKKLLTNGNKITSHQS